MPALRLLLGRLRDLGGVVLSAVVASSRLAALPEVERSLLPEPVDLATVTDLEELRLRITRAQGRVGLPEGAAKEGNNRKRIQLRLAVPGYGPDDAARLAEDLANPQTPANGGAALSAAELLADVGELDQAGEPVHNALALLWMIEHVGAGGARLVPWPEFRRDAGAFLAEFADSPGTPEYPFWHLGSAGRLWEVHGVTDVPISADVTAVAGLTRQAAILLRDRTVRTKAINILLNRYLSGASNQQTLRQRFGVARRAPLARDVLRRLVGVEIRTVSERRPNMIVAMHENTVTVRTDQSPGGQPVQISAVQNGLDKLTRQGSVQANVDELGYRSAFVGAVLATLPTAQVSANPATITLDDVGVADNRVVEVTDAVAQVKIRREQARLRKLLIAGRDIAPCALCGHEYPVEFLVAAHVKRRGVCTDNERRDLYNVAMLACAFGCDDLYENGWITVDTTGHIRTAPLDGQPAAFLDRTRVLDGLLCLVHHENSEPYFAWHRATIFRGASSYTPA